MPDKKGKGRRKHVAVIEDFSPREAPDTSQIRAAALRQGGAAAPSASAAAPPPKGDQLTWTFKGVAAAVALEAKKAGAAGVAGARTAASVAASAGSAALGPNALKVIGVAAEGVGVLATTAAGFATATLENISTRELTHREVVKIFKALIQSIANNPKLTSELNTYVCGRLERELFTDQQLPKNEQSSLLNNLRRDREGTTQVEVAHFEKERKAISEAIKQFRKEYRKVIVDAQQAIPTEDPHRQEKIEYIHQFGYAIDRVFVILSQLVGHLDFEQSQILLREITTNIPILRDARVLIQDAADFYNNTIAGNDSFFSAAFPSEKSADSADTEATKLLAAFLQRVVLEAISDTPLQQAFIDIATNDLMRHIASRGILALQDMTTNQKKITLEMWKEVVSLVMREAKKTTVDTTANLLIDTTYRLGMQFSQFIEDEESYYAERKRAEQNIVGILESRLVQINLQKDSLIDSAQRNLHTLGNDFPVLAEAVENKISQCENKHDFTEKLKNCRQEHSSAISGVRALFQQHRPNSNLGENRSVITKQKQRSASQARSEEAVAKRLLTAKIEEFSQKVIAWFEFQRTKNILNRESFIPDVTLDSWIEELKILAVHNVDEFSREITDLSNLVNSSIKQLKELDIAITQQLESEATQREEERQRRLEEEKQRKKEAAASQFIKTVKITLRASRFIRNTKVQVTQRKEGEEQARLAQIKEFRILKKHLDSESAARVLEYKAMAQEVSEKFSQQFPDPRRPRLNRTLFPRHGERGACRANELAQNMRDCTTETDCRDVLRTFLDRYAAQGGIENTKIHKSVNTLIVLAILSRPLLCTNLLPQQVQVAVEDAVADGYLALDARNIGTETRNDTRQFYDNYVIDIEAALDTIRVQLGTQLGQISETGQQEVVQAFNAVVVSAAESFKQQFPDVEQPRLNFSFYPSRHGLTGLRRAQDLVNALDNCRTEATCKQVLREFLVKPGTGGYDVTSFKTKLLEAILKNEIVRSILLPTFDLNDTRCTQREDVFFVLLEADRKALLGQIAESLSNPVRSASADDAQAVRPRAGSSLLRTNSH